MMDSTGWVLFEDRLPTLQDADTNGEIDLRERNGDRRLGLWNWIPPDRRGAVKLWLRNGFVAWRPFNTPDTSA